MLTTTHTHESETTLLRARQWTVEARYNEFYVNRYICLLEERSMRWEPDEQSQCLVFSIWDVDQSICSRNVADEEKSSLLEVFGWLPVVVQLRRGPVYLSPADCPCEPRNLTWQRPLPEKALSTFFHFANYLLSSAPRALFQPAKISLLSLCEEAHRSEAHWQEFLAEMGWVHH